MDVSILEIIRDLLLILSGATIAFFFSYLIDKMRLIKKRKDLTKLIISDITLHIEPLIILGTKLKDEDFAKKSDDELCEMFRALFSISSVEPPIYNKNLFQSILSELTLLPKKSISKVLHHYNHMNKTDRMVKKARKEINMISIWKVVALTKLALMHAYATLYTLYKEILKLEQRALGFAKQFGLLLTSAVYPSKKYSDQIRKRLDLHEEENLSILLRRGGIPKGNMIETDKSSMKHIEEIIEDWEPSLD